MNRIDFTNKINTYAARFVLEVEGFNATSGDSDERDHSNPAQADHPFRAKLTT